MKFNVEIPKAVPETTSVFGLSAGVLGASLVLCRNRRKAILKK